MGPAALGSQNWGMHPEPRQRSWHSRGEQSFLPGACPCKKQIGFCSGPCEGRKSATLGSSLPKAFPLGGRWAGEAGSDEGAILYPTFPCRKGGSPGRRPNGFLLLLRWATRSPPHQSPSVTASPQGEASGLCSPTRKKRSKSGYVHGYRTSPSTGTMRPTTPKRASGNERAINPGVQGACPRPSFSPFLGRNGDPAGQAGPPGRCAPRHRKSPDRPKGTQCRPAPPPGTGRETTSQGPPCGGPEGTPSLPKRTPSRWAAWGPFHVCDTVVAGGAGTLTPGPRRSGGPCWPAPGRLRRSRPRRRGPPGSPSGSEGGCPRRRRG